jgi:type II secretory pathway pseudopilin PulG
MRITRKKLPKHGFTLLETLVVCGLFSVITTFLVVFYRSADVEFSQSMTTMSMSERAREVATKIIPYASTAVPCSVSQVAFIYSPLDSSSLSVDPTMSPSVYDLDFCTSNDLLVPTDQGSIANCRGTETYLRYRIRFDPTSGFLYLERVNETLATGTSSSAQTLAPAYEPSSTYAPRILGRDLQEVTFSRSGDSIALKIVVRSVLRNGKWLEGQIHKGMEGTVKNLDPTVAENVGYGQQYLAKEYTLFSTVMIPFYSGQ